MFEIMKYVRAAAGKEPFFGISRVLAFESGIQHGRQTLVPALQEITNCPAAENIAGVNLLSIKYFRRQRRIFVMQRFDNFKIGHQRPQFCGGT